MTSLPAPGFDSEGQALPLTKADRLALDHVRYTFPWWGALGALLMVLAPVALVAIHAGLTPDYGYDDTTFGMDWLVPGVLAGPLFVGGCMLTALGEVWQLLANRK